jgi:hypothetical protein
MLWLILVFSNRSIDLSGFESSIIYSEEKWSLFGGPPKLNISNADRERKLPFLIAKV